MSTTTAPGDEERFRSKTQQSPIATKRAQSQANDRLPKPPNSNYFPLGYKEGFCQWWANIPSAVAEHRVLSFIPHLRKPPTQLQTGSAPPSASASQTSIVESNPSASESETTNTLNDPYGPRLWHSDLVRLSGKNRALNEFSVERLNDGVENNLVMLHGYGAGLGFFYKNFEGLSRAPGWRIYALDMLGMGRSSRPPFKIHAKGHQEKITEAENWFIDALEEWRIKKKINRFTLLGHSMGGYMAVAYALKYPGHLKKLILASPVGIPEDPYAVSAEMPDPEDSTMANEFTQDQDEAVRSNVSSGTSTPTKPGPQVPRRPLPKWVTYLWDANISPFSIVRWAGPLGPRFVSGWTSRRFSHLPAPEAQALHDYSYSLFKQRGSGEYALAYILAPGAFARSPLIRRIENVGRQIIKPAEQNGGVEVREKGIPVMMMYGENDWMDVAGGYAAEEKFRVEKQKWTEKNGEEEGGEAKVVIIKKAGHHVYLDGWEEFNEIMLQEMAKTSAKDKDC
ncbi:MAG: hypothetical protein M1834_006002 [Cirrosporium novae-zelandiae]|nr:MAG: hypothetical protein M1834_006002 [Cirrosporium novae-zelandiae]